MNKAKANEINQTMLYVSNKSFVNISNIQARNTVLVIVWQKLFLKYPTCIKLNHVFPLLLPIRLCITFKLSKKTSK